MFSRFSKIKDTFVENRIEAQKKKVALVEEKVKNDDTKDFLSNIKKLSETIFPYKSPTQFSNGFREYKSLNEINFRTPEKRYSREQMVEKTGLKSVRYVGGWDCDKWEANYKEYVSLHESTTANNARAIKSLLSDIHARISSSKDEYSDFVVKYLETISNVIGIVDHYGMTFILEEYEIFDNIQMLVENFVADFENYTEVVRQFKKAQALEKLSIEQDYVRKMICDSSMMIEYNQK